MTSSTETRILDAAEKLFGERGYAATTTRLLADRAGVNEVTLFRLFGNKIGVLRAVFNRAGIAQVQHDALAGTLPADPREALSMLARREIGHTVRLRIVAMRISFDATSVPELAQFIDQGPAENLKSLAELFRRWQGGGQVRRDLDPRVLAEAFSSITSSVVMYRDVLGVNPTEDLPLDEVVAQLVDVFMTGVLEEH